MEFFQILPFILSGCTVLFAVFFIVFRQKDSKFRTMAFKGTAALFFILTAVFAAFANNGKPLFATLIICGGLFGLMGDGSLAIKGIAPSHFKKLVAVGMSFFAIGHIFYFGAVLVSTEIYPLSFIIGLAFVAVAFFGFKMKRFSEIGVMQFPCYVYYYILATTLVQSFFGAVFSGELFAIVFFVGTAFFFVSDTLLSFMYFGNAKGRTVSIVNLSSYYIAQILIALSIMFV